MNCSKSTASETVPKTQENITMRTITNSDIIMRMKHKNGRKNVLIALRMAGVAGRGKLNGILRHLNDHGGWNIQLVRTALELTPETIEDALARDTDGFIVSLPGSDRAIRPLLESSVPLVLLDTPSESIPSGRRNLSTIHNDPTAVGFAAADHLLAQNSFASYGYVCNDSTAWARDRGDAFERRLAKRGIPCLRYASALNGTIVPDRAGMLSWLLALRKPAALFVDCDDHAHSLLDICSDAGIDVPREIAVIGVGNDTVICSHSSPRLSSILPDFEGEGMLAAELLSEMMAQPRRRRRQSHFSKGVADVILRESSMPVSPAGHLVARGMRFIEENALRGIGVDDVARHLGVSRSLAMLRFREAKRKSIFAEIRECRLNAVVNLLETSCLPIVDVSQKCGFENVNHLKNIFKRRFGMSMREWRATHV